MCLPSGIVGIPDGIRLAPSGFGPGSGLVDMSARFAAGAASIRQDPALLINWHACWYFREKWPVPVPVPPVTQPPHRAPHALASARGMGHSGEGIDVQIGTRAQEITDEQLP